MALPAILSKVLAYYPISDKDLIGSKQIAVPCMVFCLSLRINMQK